MQFDRSRSRPVPALPLISLYLLLVTVCDRLEGFDRPLVATDEELTVNVGFDGVYQVGRWTPISLESHLSDELTEANATVVDVDGRPVSFPLHARGNHFEGLFQAGRLDSAVRVSATTSDGRLFERTMPTGVEGGIQSVRQDTSLWMLVGRQVGFTRAAEQLNSIASEADRTPAVHVLPIDAAELPTDPQALDGVQLLVLGADPVALEQSHAVRDWVRRGGRLVLTIGNDVSGYRQSPISQWVPVPVEDAYHEQQTVALTGRITAYVPNQGILRSLNELEVARLDRGGGVTIIEGPSAPVVVRTAHGLGTITVVALDMNSSPFVLRPAASDDSRPTTWGGLPAMCLQLAGAEVNRADSLAAARELQLAPTGISDLYSQLAGILDHFPDVNRASSWNVIGLIAFYLLVVGPLDYFVVHKLLHRPQLTWVTLPVWILLAGWWAATSADSGNGLAMTTRQIAVLDVAADTGTQRVTGWLSLYSPETRRHNISFRPTPGLPGTAAEIRLAPLGRPEEGFRGMYRRGGINLGGARYGIKNGNEVALAQQAPVEQWSSLGFVGDSVWLRPSTDPPVAECRMVSDDRGNEVGFELTHRLPGELTDWFAVSQLEATFPIEAHPELLRLAPGQTYSLLGNCGQKLLRAYLQGEITEERKRKTGSDFYTRSDSYDPLGLDPDRLFSILSFHDAIGGGGFTHLANRTLERHDFSSVIHLDRLVVCGRLSSAVAEFAVDGESVVPQSKDTFVRLIVPIVREIVPAAPESILRD